MEGGIAEEDCDEYDKLLGGKIPNTSYGNSLTVHHRLIVPFQGLDIISLELEKESPCRKDTKLFSPRSKSLNLYKSPLPATQQENMSIYPDDKKLQEKGTNCKISEMIAGQDNSNLPDDNSLTMSFDEMRIKENIAMILSSSTPANQNSSEITCLPNGQSANHLSKSLFGYDMLDMNFPPLSRTVNGVTLPSIELESQSPILQRTGFVNLSYGNDCRRNPKLFKPDGYEPKPISEIVFGSFSERYVQFNSQYLYAENLQNYSPEAIQVQKIMNLGMRPLNGNKVHQCVEFPIPRRFEQCYQNPYMNASVLDYKSNQLNYCQYQHWGSSGRVENSSSSHGEKLLSSNGSTCSVKDFHGQQIFDRVVKKSFPEKILRRSHGADTVAIPRPNPLTTDQSLHLNEKNVRLSDCHTHQPCCLSNGFLRLDNQNHRYSPPVGFDPRLSLQPMQIKYNSVDDVIGRVYLMAKNQHGCRFLQKKLTQCSQEDIDEILFEIICHIVELITHPFGNYFVQKLLELCNEVQMTLILKVITRTTGELFRMSCDMHGFTTDDILLLSLSLPPLILFLLVVECYTGEDFMSLYGEENYVVQFVLDLKDPRTIAAVLNQLKGNYEHLSMQKYGSNVVEKCLKFSGENNCVQIIEELMNSPRLRQILQDKYGNYVMQSALSESKMYRDLHVALVATIKRHDWALRNSPYGKKVLSRASFSDEKKKFVISTITFKYAFLTDILQLLFLIAARGHLV
ncbi:Putative pumilio like 7, chloroplastic [Dendrobium catenatum]|uniref:Pumilio like 7, chloroplastic n=1 Tax=Dendrobium catenatum TaxID=906689 RepID=A0A2I0V6S2_9ASPA|nr:Putative pumilio like 7, chloroplastic [Dendrobium catenatum]